MAGLGLSLHPPAGHKVGLTQEFLREKPELGAFSSGRRARDSCELQSPAELQDGCQALVCAGWF